jgi:chromosome segregation ATPase
MGEASNPFRGTTFGGFNRQDVLNYLSKTETEHEKVVSSLRTELEESQKGRAEDRLRLEELEATMESETKRSKALQEELDKKETVRQQTEDALRQAQEEIKLLRASVAEFEPKALAYGRIKDRAAAIELDAHERAQLTLDQAKEEISQIQDNCSSWIQEVQAGYEQLRMAINETFTKSTVELELICKTFDRIAIEFDEHEDGIRTIRSKVEELKSNREEEAY